MKPHTLKISGLTLALSLLTMSATGVAARSRHPEPPPPPPPPAPAAAVSLPTGLVNDAAAYEAYVERLAATSPAFTDGAGVAQALTASAAFDPKVMLRGSIAYAAIAALESGAFVSEIRNAGNSPDNRRAMVGYIQANPAYVYVFRGSDEAAGYAKAALGGAGEHLRATGKAVIASAYSVQKQAWSKGEIVDRPGRLAAVEAAASSPVNPAADRIALLQSAATGASGLSIKGEPIKPPYGSLVDRALQLAAIAALGETSNPSYDAVNGVAEDPITGGCLLMARHNLYQCLAVAKPHYEDIFCIGQHILTDTGRCLSRNAGLAEPVEVVPVQAPVKAKKAKHPGRRK